MHSDIIDRDVTLPAVTTLSFESEAVRVDCELRVLPSVALVSADGPCRRAVHLDAQRANVRAVHVIVEGGGRDPGGPARAAVVSEVVEVTSLAGRAGLRVEEAATIARVVAGLRSRPP